MSMPEAEHSDKIFLSSQLWLRLGTGKCRLGAPHQPATPGYDIVTQNEAYSVK
jgi:hypothetical protein